MIVGRRRALLLSAALLLPTALFLTACAGGGGRPEPVVARSFAPLRYDYLTPIGLRVGSIEVLQRFVPAEGTQELTARDPVPPAEAVRQMALDRLHALGTAGRAVLSIDDATLARTSAGYEGSIAVELDIYTSNDERAAFAEARVAARRSGDTEADERQALYELTKQLMDQLNVELEYQIRRNLADWIVMAPSETQAPVEQQPLPPP